MFIVEKAETTKSGGYIEYHWKRDRSYKIFDNAENRVEELQRSGINARMIEDKRK